MGIDRIGKGGTSPLIPDTQGAEGVAKKGSAGDDFAAALEKVKGPERVDAAKHAAQAGAVEASQSRAALERLRAGEIDVNGYVDLKVEEATRGLEGLSRAELDDIRKMLREQLSTDPALVDLVRTATGHVPSPPED
jgi:uncharacterized protein with von Willebrand factor type A (vWA) domain